MNLKQHQWRLGTIKPKLNRSKDVKLKVHFPTIRQDINKFKSIADGDGVDAEKAERVLKFIKAISEQVNMKECTLPIDWVIDDATERLSAKSLDLWHDDSIGFNAIDYVDKDFHNIYILSFKELANMIAYNMMFYEYGEDICSINKKLADIGTEIPAPSSRLCKLFEGEEPYESAKYMRVSNSPYYNYETDKLQEYFYEGIQFNGKSYWEAVHSSCLRAAAFIASDIFEVCSNCYNNFPKLCYYDAEQVVFVTLNNEINSSIITELLRPVTMQAFGRQFDVYINYRIITKDGEWNNDNIKELIGKDEQDSE